jgi:hypothetical protein
MKIQVLKEDSNLMARIREAERVLNNLKLTIQYHPHYGIVIDDALSGMSFIQKDDCGNTGESFPETFEMRYIRFDNYGELD